MKVDPRFARAAAVAEDTLTAICAVHSPPPPAPPPTYRTGTKVESHAPQEPRERPTRPYPASAAPVPPSPPTSTVPIHTGFATRIKITSQRVLLRDYQHRTLDSIYEAICSGHRGIVCSLPTGAGKTVLIAHWIAEQRAKGMRGVFLVKNTALIEQAADKLNALGVEFGYLAGGYARSNRPFQIGTIQAAERRGIWRPDFAVIDEAHNGQFHDAARELISAGTLVVGLTATPGGLGHTYSKLLLGARYSELIAAGSIVPARVYAPHIPTLRGCRIAKGEITEASAMDVMGGRVLAEMVRHWRAITPGRRTVIFAVRVDHAKEIAAQFRDAGIPAAAISSDTCKTERTVLYKALASGELLVLANVGIIGEGWDCPALEVIGLARPTASFNLLCQQVGRGARPCRETAKTHFTVLDYAGCYLMHGNPMADTAWDLNEATNFRRTQTLTSAAAIRICASCLFVYAPGSPACPSCGAAPKGKAVRYVRGELQEIDPAEQAIKPDAVRAIHDATARRRWLYGVGRFRPEVRKFGTIHGWVNHHLNAFTVEAIKEHTSWEDYKTRLLAKSSSDARQSKSQPQTPLPFTASSSRK